MNGGVKHQWSERKLRVRVTPTGPLEDAYVCQACGTVRQIRSSAPSCAGPSRRPDPTLVRIVESDPTLRRMFGSGAVSE